MIIPGSDRDAKQINPPLLVYAPAVLRVRRYRRWLPAGASLDVAPDPEAWKNIQKYVARVTPKVGQLDIQQIINGNFVKTLDETGFIAEAKKRHGL